MIEVRKLLEIRSDIEGDIDVNLDIVREKVKDENTNVVEVDEHISDSPVGDALVMELVFDESSSFQNMIVLCCSMTALLCRILLLVTPTLLLSPTRLPLPRFRITFPPLFAFALPLFELLLVVLGSWRGLRFEAKNFGSLGAIAGGLYKTNRRFRNLRGEKLEGSKDNRIFEEIYVKNLGLAEH